MEQNQANKKCQYCGMVGPERGFLVHLVHSTSEKKKTYLVEDGIYNNKKTYLLEQKPRTPRQGGVWQRDSAPTMSMQNTLIIKVVFF